MKTTRWIVGTILFVAFVYVATLPFQRELEMVREAELNMVIPDDAEIVFARSTTDIVFRLPRSRSVDAWLDYVCSQNQKYGAHWTRVSNHLRVMSCTNSRLWYSPEQNEFEFVDGCVDCVCGPD